jgi:hypothetical protein
MKKSSLAIPAVIMAGVIGAPLVATAQVIPERQPPVESATAARIKAPYRESTILRPSTSTGMSRSTPGARHNWYKEPAN